MNTTLVFSMIGPDRLGIVDELTQLLLQVDGNVETSRMARLGGEFAMLLQVSLPEGNVPRLEQLTEPLNDQGYAITWKATGSSSPATAGGCNYYRLSVAGADTSELTTLFKDHEPSVDNAIARIENIRIVDDEYLVRIGISAAIDWEQHGIAIIGEASNGQEAVVLWQDESIDLVLMDIQMPVMDGLKALAVIRAAEDTIRRHTLIIALTAHAIVGDRERLLNAGFDGYLAKPLQVSKLFEEMARVLEQIGREKLR